MTRKSWIFLMATTWMLTAAAHKEKSASPKLPKLPPMSTEESQVVKDQEAKIREEMLKISRQLGVTCNYCHDVSNFRSDKLVPFKVAKDHMALTSFIRKNHFKGSEKVDCYMCHRGDAKPPYFEKGGEKTSK